MQIINKLSQKEKNLIYIFSIMVIFLVSYQFGFVKLNEKTDALYSENTELNAKLSDLQLKAANKDRYIEETNSMNEDITKMLDNLSTSLTQEKSTMFVIDLESRANMKVSAIAYGELSEIYSSNKATTDEATDATDGETEDTTTTETSSSDVSAGDGMEVQDTEYKGYKSSITINYQTNYAGLKNAIDYINQYEEKMKIQSLTAAFDNTTGNLTGTIMIDTYALLGAGREVKPVDIYGVNVGTDNIFGTFELPVE